MATPGTMSHAHQGSSCCQHCTTDEIIFLRGVQNSASLLTMSRGPGVWDFSACSRCMCSA